jgi:SAM-dependent methyltransferase
VIHDVCSQRPFPFPDQMFDFVVCSHVLEDVRDPLRVCAEMMRVGRAGYIETPSRIGESILWNGMVGAAHHRWFVEAEGQTLRFRMKHHFLHNSPKYYISTSFARRIPLEARYLYFFWDQAFEYEEIGGYEYYGETADFIGRLQIPRYYYTLDRLRQIKAAGTRFYHNLAQRCRQRLRPSAACKAQETWTWEKLFEANRYLIRRV